MVTRPVSHQRRKPRVDRREGQQDFLGGCGDRNIDLHLLRWITANGPPILEGVLAISGALRRKDIQWQRTRFASGTTRVPKPLRAFTPRPFPTAPWAPSGGRPVIIHPARRVTCWSSNSRLPASPASG